MRMILKHHLHIAPQLAGKGFARLHGGIRQRHLAAPVRIQSGHYPQQRGFTAAGRPHQAETLAGRHLQVHIVHHGAQFITLFVRDAQVG